MTLLTFSGIQLGDLMAFCCLIRPVSPICSLPLFLSLSIPLTPRRIQTEIIQAWNLSYPIPTYITIFILFYSFIISRLLANTYTSNQVNEPLTYRICDPECDLALFINLIQIKWRKQSFTLYLFQFSCV